METNGADVIAYKDNVKYVIQAKFYNNPVSNKAVQEVVGAIGMYKADKGIVVTNSTFTPSAIELAQANNIELVDKDKIEEFRKMIIKDSTDNTEKYVEDVSEEYIDKITDDWNILLEKENILQIDFTPNNKAFELLAKLYLEDAEYSDKNLENFVDAFSKYVKFGDGKCIKDREDGELIKICIKRAIYKEHFMHRIEDILNIDKVISDEIKKKIYYEYFLDTSEDIFMVYKVMVLEQLFNESTQEIIDEIEYYRTKAENGEFEEYLTNRVREVTERVREIEERINKSKEDDYEENIFGDSYSNDYENIGNNIDFDDDLDDDFDSFDSDDFLDD